MSYIIKNPTTLEMTTVNTTFIMLMRMLMRMIMFI